jgi:hypothetical protein
MEELLLLVECFDPVVLEFIAVVICLPVELLLAVCEELTPGPPMSLAYWLNKHAGH